MEVDHWNVGESEDSWHTFHEIIFYIFCVLIKLNVTARVGVNILGLQSDLHKHNTIKRKSSDRHFLQSLHVYQSAPQTG